MSTDVAAIDVAASLKRDQAPVAAREVVFGIDDLSVTYGSNLAVKGVSLDIYRNLITAMIGPSGCGKSTFIRCLNRMNDLVPGAKVGGRILYHGEDLYGPEADPVEVRRRIGMVFQRPNPFPKSIYDNVAFAPKMLGMGGNMDERVERALRGRRALGRGQGPPEAQRARALGRPAAAPLHRARARGRARGDPARRARLGARPDLDRGDRGPDARAQARLHARDRHPQHAAGGPRRRHDRVLQPRGRARPTATAILVEYDETAKIFTHPSDKRTEDYVTGRFG